MIDLVKRLPQGGQESFTNIGQPQASGVADEQFSSDVLLKRTNMAADCGLGVSKLLASGGENEGSSGTFKQTEINKKGGGGHSRKNLGISQLGITQPRKTV